MYKIAGLHLSRGRDKVDNGQGGLTLGWYDTTKFNISTQKWIPNVSHPENGWWQVKVVTSVDGGTLTPGRYQRKPPRSGVQCGYQNRRGRHWNRLIPNIANLQRGFIFPRLRLPHFTRLFRAVKLTQLIPYIMQSHAPPLPKLRL
jgi:hypothetical protein